MWCSVHRLHGDSLCGDRICGQSSAGARSRIGQLQKFARSNFKRWFKSHVSTGSRKVAYFVDTYADLCEPETGKAVVRILELNGCAVVVPKQVGSGMPAFLYGDVKRTKRAAEVSRQPKTTRPPEPFSGFEFVKIFT